MNRREEGREQSLDMPCFHLAFQRYQRRERKTIPAEHSRHQ